MHLGALQKVFPFFAASSQTNCTKSVWSYMRRMEGRDIKNSKLLQKYLEVYNVLRRADKKRWEGLSIHLVNEEVLMRSLQFTGGLAQGREFI